MAAIGAAPQIDVRSAVGAELSTGALGEAVSNVGQVFGRLAQEQAELKNREAVAGAELVLAEESNKLALALANEDDETQWIKLTEEHSRNVKAALLDNRSLSPAARAEIASRVGLWSQGRYGDAAIASFDRTRKKTLNTQEAVRQRSLDANDWAKADGAVDDMVNSGLVDPGKGDLMKLENKRAQQSFFKGEADNYFKMALATGDESFVDLAANSLMVSGATDNDIKAFRLSAARDVSEAKDRLNNEAQADTIGDLLWRKAKGEKLLPSEIEGLKERGLLDAAKASQFLADAKVGVGVLDGEFSKFLDEVALYDPDDDSKFAKKAELMRRAADMPMRPDQAQSFMDVFNKAQQDNADVDKKFETAALVGARAQVRALFSSTGASRVWTKDLELALSDTGKLEKFGVSAPTAAKIRALMGIDSSGKPADEVTIKEDGKDVTVSKNYAEAFRLFKQSAVTRPDRATSGLSQFEYDLFERAANSDADGMLIDKQRKINDAMNEPVLIEQLERWFQGEAKKNGVPPTDIEVKKRIGQLTSTVLHSRGADAFVEYENPLLPRVDGGAESQRYTMTPDGGYEGTASSYGFEGDDDNGYNSLGMLRGEQPWYGTMPTVALAPKMAEELGIRLPVRKKGGEWDTSGSVVEIEADGKKIKAIFDETGMFINKASMDKLVDLTPEASNALGLPINSNAKVIVRKPKQ